MIARWTTIARAHRGEWLGLYATAIMLAAVLGSVPI
jgi:hypothetical protein